MHTGILAILITFTACTTQGPLAQADPSELPENAAAFIKAHLPGIKLTPTSGVKPIETATAWYPLKAQTMTYAAPEDPNKALVHVMSKTAREPGHPVGSTEGGWSVQLEDKSIQFLRVDAHRGIVMPTVVSPADGVITRLNPPEALVIQGHVPGDDETSDIKVRVYDLHEPSVLCHSGQLHATWQDLGAWRITVPKGTFDTRLVALHLKGKVGPASLDIERYYFLAKGVGVVAYAAEASVHAVLVYNSDTVQAGVLKAITPAKH
ncbi:MAG: hypothetical protein MK101_05160 [Phycisphaerales bacterium]|nr:hypothetical protein [Phycisphaerales bacterium]